MKNILLIAFSSLIAFSCVTPLAKRLEGIHVGMLKDEILDVAGSPTTFARYKGRDRWIYRIPQGSDIKVTEIQFENGKAIYVGAPVVSNLSAEEQDKYNQMYNDLAEKTESEVRKARKKKLHPQDDEEEL